MLKRILALFTIGNFVLTGCYKNHLYVQQEKVDQSFLASSYVHTPDPRQKHPPQGGRLLIAWDFPLSLFRKNLALVTTVRLWNQTQEIFVHPVERKRDSLAYYFPNDLPDTDQRILTYRVQVISEEGEVVETWEHHFWTERIDVDNLESFSSPRSKSSSVSSQPKQASVIDTP